MEKKADKAVGILDLWQENIWASGVVNFRSAEYFYFSEYQAENSYRSS